MSDGRIYTCERCHKCKEAWIDNRHGLCKKCRVEKCPKCGKNKGFTTRHVCMAPVAESDGHSVETTKRKYRDQAYIYC